MKKILIFLLAGTMIFGVVGCGQKDTTTEEDNQVIIENSDNKDKEENNASSSVGFGVEAVKSASETDASMFQYEEVEGGIAITDYTGEDEIVVIPKQIDGQDVVVVGEYAFANYEHVKAVKIADSVVAIGESAFGNCTGLEIVICGEGLSTIGEYAFNYCDSLYHLELNEGLETLELSCFPLNDVLKEVYIPSSVVNIDGILVASQTDVTIITEAGSAAEQYANEEGIPCKTK